MKMGGNLNAWGCSGRVEGVRENERVHTLSLGRICEKKSKQFIIKTLNASQDASQFDLENLMKVATVGPLLAEFDFKHSKQIFKGHCW